MDLHTLERLSGPLGPIRGERRHREFVLDHLGGAGLTPGAIAASLTGMGAAAVGIANLETAEPADYVDTDIGGVPVTGWFWRFPYRQGETITVVGQRRAGVFHAIMAERTRDGLIAVHPHCTRGVRAHWVSSTWFWAKVLSVLFLLAGAMMMTIAWAGGKVEPWRVLVFLAGYGLPACLAVFGFLAYRATVKLEGFAVVAQAAFGAFGWGSPTRIDLPARSRHTRRDGDSDEFGRTMFRVRGPSDATPAPPG